VPSNRDLVHLIEVVLPDRDGSFADCLASFLSPCGKRQDDCFHIAPSDPTQLPRVTVRFAREGSVSVRFVSGLATVVVDVVNVTGREVRSPHVYSHIALTDVAERLQDGPPEFLDHVGVDLPWFGELHPSIEALRATIANKTAYYLFPTGEPWDFILPAHEEEILLHREMDLTVTRRPKFEIVSIDKVSTPILQFDIAVPYSFERIASLFPEGIADSRQRNVWVYVDSPMALDVCLVLNEGQMNTDWCEFFSGHRLTTRNT